MLREPVIVRTPSGDLHGVLFVGVDGLPELMIRSQQIGPTVASIPYRPATFPAAWTLKYVLDPNGVPMLFAAWQAIDRIRRDIIRTQREADAEEQREPDAMDAYKRDAEARGER